jgi:hypothetical protein
MIKKKQLDDGAITMHEISAPVISSAAARSAGRTIFPSN